MEKKAGELLQALNRAAQMLLISSDAGQQQITMATDGIVDLLKGLEAVLQDGLVDFPLTIGAPTFWHVAVKLPDLRIAGAENMVTTIKRSSAPKTDLGRGRAFVRMSLNSGHLARVLVPLLDSQLITEYYAKTSVLRNDMAANMLPMMLEMLEQLKFTLPVDDALQDVPNLWSLPIAQITAGATAKDSSFGDWLRNKLSTATVASTPSSPSGTDASAAVAATTDSLTAPTAGSDSPLDFIRGAANTISQKIKNVDEHGQPLATLVGAFPMAADTVEVIAVPKRRARKKSARAVAVEEGESFNDFDLSPAACALAAMKKAAMSATTTANIVTSPPVAEQTTEAVAPVVVAALPADVVEAPAVMPSAQVSEPVLTTPELPAQTAARLSPPPVPVMTDVEIEHASTEPVGIEESIAAAAAEFAADSADIVSSAVDPVSTTVDTFVAASLPSSPIELHAEQTIVAAVSAARPAVAETVASVSEPIPAVLASVSAANDTLAKPLVSTQMPTAAVMSRPPIEMDKLHYRLSVLDPRGTMLAEDRETIRELQLLQAELAAALAETEPAASQEQSVESVVTRQLTSPVTESASTVEPATTVPQAVSEPAVEMASEHESEPESEQSVNDTMSVSSVSVIAAIATSDSAATIDPVENVSEPVSVTAVSDVSDSDVVHPDTSLSDPPMEESVAPVIVPDIPVAATPVETEPKPKVAFAEVAPRPARKALSNEERKAELDKLRYRLSVLDPRESLVPQDRDTLRSLAELQNELEALRHSEQQLQQSLIAELVKAQPAVATPSRPISQADAGPGAEPVKPTAPMQRDAITPATGLAIEVPVAANPVVSVPCMLRAIDGDDDDVAPTSPVAPSQTSPLSDGADKRTSTKDNRRRAMNLGYMRSGDQKATGEETIRMLQTVAEVGVSEAVQLHTVVEAARRSSVQLADFNPRAPTIILELYEEDKRPQNPNCHQCQNPLDQFKRFCYYSGRWYCGNCHQFEAAIIPARVLKLWDFETQRVCHAAAEFLDISFTEPTFDVNAFVDGVKALKEFQVTRRNLKSMGEYISSCSLKSSSLLGMLKSEREYMLVSDSTYSMHDLLQLHDGLLPMLLRTVMGPYERHIVTGCELCKGRGFICEFCNSKEPIFPFQPNVVKCTGCNSYFHEKCYRPGLCPMCSRMELARLKRGLPTPKQ
eukprot:TRINITY_DN11540_c0_g1_i1.p1 TRINITY_DN11540_c0_g1~~TRINITY_DN11540_c0_g1_i1.p1  ORF type:complete len:1177 (+),score=257.35 TRINITY_DN11540_c0_g1_i1:63-3593(+)